MLRQLKPPAQALMTPTMQPSSFEQEGEGLARLETSPERHPRVQLKKEATESFVPSQNLIRDNQGREGEEMRDLRFRSGKEIVLNKQKILSDDDFEKNEITGLSPAETHIKAANLATAYQQTVKEEVNFQKSFNNNVRTLLTRDEVVIGLMHLWDFIQAYVGNPSSKALTAQLFLIVHHCHEEGILRESLLTIGEPESRWLLDLIDLLQTIVVQERSMSIAEKVAAINYSVLTLSSHYAKKIYKSLFVPMDKEAKIATFYMRVVLQILILSDELGIYRNERVEKAISNTRKREMSDKELMYHLHKALTGIESDDDDAVDLEESDFTRR
ncbi:p52K [Bottlenose dolphin adenovirus 1]|uniref:p52K n=1 Tax=Bottlenose dolphin adenovirus 1 TaxID=1714377 RepID=A0A1X7MMJ8_9ADEN|nr:p52K [Bottlenose dolphin adenovirus 1]SMG83442.1 p52K [Bottlenose dolphin adenovirus 1]